MAVARSTYRLPYFWSAMRLEQRGPEIAYGCQRRWPGPGADSRVRVRIGELIRPGQVTDRDHFLTARWILFSVSGSRQRLARACHSPWPLHRARARLVDDALITAAGLPAPRGEPLVLYSPGVDVRIGRPERTA